MRGFRVFLGKEFQEIFRTWRIFILPSIMVAVGLLSPVLAKIMPDIIGSAASAQPGVVIELPAPTTMDAYLTFSKNLFQIVTIAVVIAMAGSIVGERKNGTAILMLTKPLSREGFVLAKVLSNWALLLGSTVVGGVACWAVTQAFFANEFVDRFVAMTALWVLLAALFVAAVAFFSVVLKSQSGAAGAGLGLFLAMTILSGWAPARDFSPAGLVSLGNRLLTGQEAAVLWPVVTAAAVAIACVAATAALFKRQEI